MSKLAKLVTILLVFLAITALTACECKHEEVIDTAIPATCTEVGYSEGTHCALCDTILVEQTQIPATGHTEEEIPEVAATCTTSGKTKGIKCATCDKLLVAPEPIDALGHNIYMSVCTRCQEFFGVFAMNYYVDDFNQPTDEKYIINVNYITGTFSNSATTNSLLNVKVLADAEDVAFFLYEYGRNPVKNPSSYYVDEYDITMKTADGTKYDLTGTLYCGGDRLYIDDKYLPTVLDALKSGDEVSFYLVHSKYTTSTYLFTVNTSNFAELYNVLF